MKLSNATLRPGTIIKVLDDGSIKATAPGLFNCIDSPDMLPPIMPLFSGSGYSRPSLYDEVWIMNFSDNPRQLYWFKKHKTLEDNTNVPMGSKNIEVLCNKNVNGDWCTIYFSDGSGWVISKGESVINIKPDGEIVLDYNNMPNRCIEINSENISIGSKGESAHPAAYGDGVENAFLCLISLLNKVQLSALANPYTAAIGTAIASQISKFKDAILEISSEHVTID